MKRLALFIGAGLGTGYAPKAPGTVGSLAALLLGYATLYVHPIAGPIVFSLIACALSLWATAVCVEEWGPDPSRFVMDEFAGQAIVLISLPFTGALTTDSLLLLLAFILFRFFDILKPLGINQLQKLKGGWGILIDDLVAGFYALITLKTLIFLIRDFF